MYFIIRTALAEAELEYDSCFVSPSVYVRFALKSLPTSIKHDYSKYNVYALIWTTTPWTLPSNQAICYNPNLEYSLVALKHLNNTSTDLYLIATNLIEDFTKTTNIECEVRQTLAGW